MKVQISEDKKSIVIELPIAPRPSKSGKTTIVAGTAGNQTSAAVWDGKPIVVGVNCYVKK